MDLALAEAASAAQKQEVPIGAIVVLGGEVISSAHNLKETKTQAIAHAEILAIEAACRKLGRWRLNDCTIFVTLEPCLMCAGAIIQSRIGRVVYGCRDLKAGAVSSLYNTLNDERLNHRPEVVSGVREAACSEVLKSFFSRLRRNSKAPTECLENL